MINCHKSILLLLACCLLFLSPLAHAAVNIHVDKGTDKAIPIAIVPFGGNDSASDKADLSQTLKNDLKFSGKFDILANDRMPASPHIAKDIDLNLWDNKPVEYIVVGKVTPQKNDSYKIRFELVTTINGKVIAGKEYSHIKASQFSRLAHHISDELYYTLTGTKGYFSTKLAYINVTNPFSIKHSIYELIVSDYDGSNPYVLARQKSNPLASPTWSDDGSQIAYVSYRNGRMAIYTIDLSTGKRHLVSSAPGINSSPTFVPDQNSLLVALSKRDSTRTNLYKINLSTLKKTAKLTSVGTNTEPDYSQNGRKITFTSTKGGSPQIYVMDSNGQHIHRVTTDGSKNFDPEFTPNGNSLVYMTVNKYNGDSNIAKINLKTRQRQLLTHGSTDKSPSVAPNGKMVIYTSRMSSGQNQVKMVSIDGRYQITLPISNPDGVIKSPAWSPFL